MLFNVSFGIVVGGYRRISHFAYDIASINRVQNVGVDSDCR